MPPKIFERTDIFKEHSPEHIAQDCADARPGPRPRNKFAAAYLCGCQGEAHYVGISKKGAFMAPSHSASELSADATSCYMGGTPAYGCTKELLRLRAVFEWLAYDPKDGRPIHEYISRRSAVYWSPHVFKRFLGGVPPQMFLPLIRCLAKKFTRHQSLVCGKYGDHGRRRGDMPEYFSDILKQASSYYAPSFEASENVPLSEALSSGHRSKGHVIDDVVSVLRRRYRHMGHLLKTSQDDQGENDIIYRYIL